MKKISVSFLIVFFGVLSMCTILLSGNIYQELPQELIELNKISPIPFQNYLNSKGFNKIKENNFLYDNQRCGTPDFQNLFSNYKKLTAETQEYTKMRFFRRPTEYFANSLDPQFLASEEKKVYELPNGHFSIHYTETLSVKNNKASFEYVEKCAKIFESVWIYEVDTLHYTAPIADIDNAADKLNVYLGGNERYDVYLLNIQDYNYYGYTTNDDPPKSIKTNADKYIFSSYIVIDNDFPEEKYKMNTYDVLRVTAAHEFFHAIQYSYDAIDANDETWWSEANAIWMEEQVYNNINAYYSYLPYFFNNPWISLFSKNPQHTYASGIFPIFLTTYFKDTSLIKKVWENSNLYRIEKGDSEKEKTSFDVIFEAIKKTLNNNNSNSDDAFNDAFNEFTIFNYFTHNNYTSAQGDRYYPDAAYNSGYYSTEISPTYVHSTYPIENFSAPAAKRPYRYASNYIIFQSEGLDSNLEISFEANEHISSSWRFNLIKLDTTGSETIEKINFYTGSFVVKNFGSIYNKAVLIPVLLKSDSTTHNYKYSAKYIDDAASPEKVSNLTAVSNGNSYVTLNWQNPADNDLKGVKIIRNLSHEPVSIEDGDTTFAGFNTTDISFLTHNKTGYYNVYSFDEMGNLSFPATVSITMFDSMAPEKMNTLKAENDDSYGKVNLSWDEYKPSLDVAGYNVYSSLMPFDSVSNLIPTYVPGKDIFDFSVSGLQNDKIYYFAVTAVDEAGNENKQVLASSATPTEDITPPSQVPIQISNGTAPNSVKIVWDVYDEKKEKDVTYYKIYRSKEPANLIFYDSVTAGDKTYTFNDIEENEIYYFAVTAVDEMNNEKIITSTQAWGYSKTTINLSNSQEIKIYKNGNYAYKGQYLGKTKDTSLIGLYLFPKTNFLTFAVSKYFNNYKIADSKLKNLNVEFTLASENYFLDSKIFLSTDKLYIAPFVIDWNYDDKKDILLGDKNGFIYLYQNIGTNDAPKFKEESLKFENNSPLQVDKNATPFVVDWDNDENKDLIVGCADGKVYYFHNIGTDESPKWDQPVTLIDFNGQEINIGEYSVPFVTDWNFDNKKDLVLSKKTDGTSIKLYIYMNQGSDYYPILSQDRIVNIKVTDKITNIVPFITDIKRIGNKIDLIVGDASGNLYEFENVANNTLPKYELIKTSTNKIIDVGEYAYPFFIDWNDDGYMDLLVGNAKGEISVFYGKFKKNIITSSGGNSNVGPCFISKLVNNNSLISKIIYFRDKYLLNNFLMKNLVEKYYKIH